MNILLNLKGDFLTFIWYSIDNTDGYPGVGSPYTHYLEDRIPVRSAAACTSSGRRGFFYKKKALRAGFFLILVPKPALYGFWLYFRVLV